MRTEITAYYQRGLEAARLQATPWGRLEFLRTWDLLTRTLPEAPADVLDVGGGAGIYAGPLAFSGYRVQLVDPMAEHVAQAALLPGVTATVGDARRLDLADASVDAVLLLGPLYHLTERADRLAAWREAARVVRPGGVVMAATISRFASLLDGFVKGYVSDARFAGMLETTLPTGAHQPPEGTPWFTTAYFHHPDELPGEVAEAGLELDRIAFVEGPLWIMGDRVADWIDDEERLRWLRRIETEPSLLGSSSHLMTICRRRSAS
ncbi:class I SAM-dependent methyltransferase [Rhizocola hellebori]|nr:class I SAM-dependent methyltransferase [Rhizocola hellebori]